MKRTRFLSLVVALCLLLTFVPAFAEGEKETITIARASDAFIEDLDTNLITLWLEEKFNVEIVFHEYPADDAQAKFAVVASSNSEMPDIVNFKLDATTTYTYGSRGVFLPLNDYFADPENTKNMDARVSPELKADILSGWTMPDGNIYGVPSFEEAPWNQASYRMWINKEWLDVLELDMPTTTDEFKEVLIAFKTQDPNGNGIADEIPLMGSTGGYGQNVIPFLLNAFVDANPNNDYFAMKDGEIYASFITDEYKDGLEYLHELAEEGLLYAPSFTQDQTQMRAIINKEGDYVVGCVTCGSYGHWTGGEKSETFKKMALLEPLTGPEGVSLTPFANPSIYCDFFITTACKNPDLAFAIGEFCYDEKFGLSNRFGVEGVNWSMEEEFLDLYFSGYEHVTGKATVAVMDDLWNEVQNAHWNQNLPRLIDKVYATMNATWLKSDYPDGYTTPQSVLYNTYLPHVPEETVKTLLYTDDETKALADIKATIDSYVKECMVAFVTGNMSFDEWDAYVESFEDMKLDEYIEIKQGAYDRIYG